MRGHRVYHGCGHAVIVMRLQWDDGVEIVEQWAYFPEWSGTGE